ncbi:hypothetical protein [Marinobacter sediminicola]|uniref:hypothetical protein n=1 Tax=Marinobacter sediminicola TaxID=3072994 RepID=UPI002811034D|nr:hypothetical protein [Marinobacter sp. F26243]
MTRPVAFSLKPNKTGTGTRLGAVAAGCLALLLSVPAVFAEESPERAKDPAYGWVLYNYHQGEAFEALTLLDVARERGGIRGHGDYPELVEGGLMLSYGMTREARELFIRLLEDEYGRSRVTLAPDVRSQAWFYLGKVFYLEGDYHLAYENLQRVDSEVLEEADSELHAEWLYLRAQLAMISEEFSDSAGGYETLIKSLKHSGPWAHYLNYNLAMADIAADDFTAAQQSLQELISVMDAESPNDDLISEHGALRDQSRLSLARLYLRDGKFDEALTLLGAMPLDGVFSDRGLFDYAVAAAGQGEMQRALDALNALSQRDLFLPWREQVPYARGYVLEQMDKPREALQAFTLAAEHYENRGEELVADKQALTEENLMARLNFHRDNDEIVTDSYGRLRVTPADFGLSEVLATEPFQQALGELNELYRMQALLAQREQQLGTFETMLETRRVQRARRSQEAGIELEQQQPDEWIEAQKAFRADIEAALAEEDAEFFMTTEQKALKARLGKVAATLAQLPDDQRTARQRKKYQRMKAYFDWSVANDYGVNRWAAQKQLRELSSEMEQLQTQRSDIEQLMAGDSEHEELASRLANNAAEVQSLKVQVDEALAQARNILISRLDNAREQQSSELRRYRVASRHAQARLADQLFRAGKSTEAAND